jgi:hypothetical protein
MIDHKIIESVFLGVEPNKYDTFLPGNVEKSGSFWYIYGKILNMSDLFYIMLDGKLWIAPLWWA